MALSGCLELNRKSHKKRKICNFLFFFYGCLVVKKKKTSYNFHVKGMIFRQELCENDMEADEKIFRYVRIFWKLRVFGSWQPNNLKIIFSAEECCGLGSNSKNAHWDAQSPNLKSCGWVHCPKGGSGDCN